MIRPATTPARRLLALALLATAWAAQAQTKLPPDDPSLYFEDATRAGDLEPEADYTLLDTGALPHRRLNLNRANRWQLLTVPGMTPTLADTLLGYRAQLGPILALQELQTLPGVTPAHLALWADWLSVAPGRGSPFPWATWQQGSLEAIGRVETTLPAAAGYTDGSYAGANRRVYLRSRYQLADRLTVGLVGETDPGEAFSIARQPGFDYLSGQVYLQEWGPAEQLVVGDYQLQLGQGLVFSRGLGVARGASTIVQPYQPRLGIVPNLSANEALYLRGAAASVRLGSTVTALVFGSSCGRDGTLGLDSLGAPELYSLSLSGLHRTETERERRAAVTEELAGAGLRLARGGLQLEAFHVYAAYRPAFAATRPTDPPGTGLHSTSLSAEVNVGSTFVFSEVAYSNQKVAGVVGLLAAPHPKADLSLHLRHTREGYTAPRPYPFAQQPPGAQNETGVYLGLYLRPRSQWRVQALADLYWQGQPSAAPGPRPTAGSELLVQLNYRPQRYTEWYLRLRYTDRPTTAPASLQTDPLDATSREQALEARLHLDRALGWRWQYRLRAEGNLTRLVEEPSRAVLRRPNGWLVYAEATHTWLRDGIALTGRLAWFDTDGGASRIYTFERTPPTRYSIPGWSGRGARIYGLVHLPVAQGVDGWLQLASTLYADRSQIGSGASALAGSSRTDVTLQLRLRLGRLAPVR